MDRVYIVEKQFSKFKTNLIDTLLSAGYILGIIFAVVGFVIVIMELRKIIKVREINGWPIVRQGGTVLSAFQEMKDGQTTFSIFVLSNTFYRKNYRTRVSFFYEVDGKVYLSERLSYYEPWSTNPLNSQLEIDRFRRGKDIDIIINPSNPAEAYIYNKPYNSFYKLAGGLLLAIFGLYIVLKTD